MNNGKRWVSTARHLPEACHSLVARLAQGGWTTHEASNGRHNLTVTAEEGDVVYFHLDAVRPELQMVHIVGGRRTGRGIRVSPLDPSIDLRRRPKRAEERL